MAEGTTPERPRFAGAGRSLEVLRAEAHDELATLIELRCRQGEDPWEVIPDLPSVDEHVVISLRADAFGHAGSGSPTGLGLDAELEFLREIALWHPPLSRAVWSLSYRLETASRH
ncbi:MULTISPECIES: hypothetical protein [unclassified Frondihabitans]|uniref:hypothetical protein n=1 Tax=unclassified Frondihabitans TaxID=2626248 RepID=UPI000F5057CA|nr:MULTISPECIES: hypothetical protein [unclassified Frondihabitans]RPE76555.1 hypothetical protein EDF37_2383 [Frondihabitans sp. PhB153]RPF05170.1 hypothetical protein EDF39_1866 [Frondihabitans sp. PhB161]